MIKLKIEFSIKGSTGKRKITEKSVKIYKLIGEE